MSEANMIERLVKSGDRVIDGAGNVGTVRDDRNIHNIHVHYDNGGWGLYCLVPECDDYYDELKRI